MGLFDRFKKTEVRADEVITYTGNPDLASRLGINGDSCITREQALTIPSVAGCVNVISGVITSLPIKLYNNETGEEIKNDIRTKLLNSDTGDTLTASQMWTQVVYDYYLGNGAIVYINKNRSKVKSLHYVKSWSKTVSVNPIFKDYRINVQGTEYQPYDFVKFLRHSEDGINSHSVLSESSSIMNVVKSSLLLEEAMNRKGGARKGFFKSSKRLDKEAIEMLKKQISIMYSSSFEERTPVLNDGIEFQEVSQSSTELQMNESKQTNSVEISMLFNVPNSILRGNASEQDIQNFVKFCIVPLVADFETSINRDLLLTKEQDKLQFRFDLDELYRGNLKERMEAYKIAVDTNIMQIDEVREKEGYRPLGFKYMKRGLGDVFLDPDTGNIFTPNTGSTQNINDSNSNTSTEVQQNLDNTTLEGGEEENA